MLLASSFLMLAPAEESEAFTVSQGTGTNVAEPFFIFHAVSPYDELAFESQPFEGFVTPEGYCMVRFIHEGEVYEEQLVRYGELAKDVEIVGPDGLLYFWTTDLSSKVKFEIDMRPITGNICLYSYYQHTGGGSAIG